MVRRMTRVVAGVAAGLLALSGMGSWATAAPRVGLADLSGPDGLALKRAALGLIVPPGTPQWCLKALRTRSSARWGTVVFSQRAAREPEVCSIHDGSMQFFHRFEGSRSWTIVGGWSSTAGERCEFEIIPPRGVWRDFGCPGARG